MASLDAQTAYDYYLQRDPQVAEAFLDAFEGLVERITIRPKSFPPCKAATRRGLMHRFPYQVVFLERADDVYVVALVAAACREKLEAEEVKARERDMVERCRVRYAEDVALAEEFFEAEREAWESSAS